MNIFSTWRKLAALWVCAVHDSAVCSGWQKGICIGVAIVLVTTIYVGTAILAVKALAIEAIKQLAKQVAKRLVKKIQKLIRKFPARTAIIAGVTANIPWADLADLLDHEHLVGASLRFILMNDYRKAMRICRCLIC